MTTLDEALLAGLAAGDRDASAAFVRRFQRRVYGLARTIVGEPGLDLLLVRWLILGRFTRSVEMLRKLGRALGPLTHGSSSSEELSFIGRALRFRPARLTRSLAQFTGFAIQ